MKSMNRGMGKWVFLGLLGFQLAAARAEVASLDAPAVPLGEALDTPALIWTTTGSAPWLGQSALSHDGVDAAQSGLINNSSSSTVQTVVTGPGTLTFWWKVSSEANNDSLRFYISGTQMSRINGEVEWQQRTYNVAAGSQVLQWSYTKNSSIASGADRAWLDQVQFGAQPVCTFAISPTNRIYGYGVATGLVTVASQDNCSWSVINTNPWLSVIAGSNGIGNGIVSYQVAANPTTSSRSGNVQIAGQLFAVTQAGAPMPTCVFSIVPTSGIHTAAGGVGEVSVSTTAGCAWSVVNSNTWVSILTNASGPGSGYVLYMFASNSVPQDRSGFINIAGQIFAITQAAAPPPPLSPVPVVLAPVQIDTIGHLFLNRNFPFPISNGPTYVLDYLIDQDQNSGGGAILPTSSINWDTNSQFSLTVSAPHGHKFMVHVPAGRAAHFGGYLWWESTRGGFSPGGSATVSFSGLEGTAPDFSESTPTLSDSHGYFGFVDLISSSFSNDLAFISITLSGTVTPQFTGHGTETYVPHHESSLQIIYATTSTEDPGSFVSIVPIAQPMLNITCETNGDVTITFTGTLQSSSEFGGTFEDVPGDPKGTYIVRKTSMSGPRYFRARAR